MFDDLIIYDSPPPAELEGAFPSREIFADAGAAYGRAARFADFDLDTPPPPGGPILLDGDIFTLPDDGFVLQPPSKGAAWDIFDRPVFTEDVVDDIVVTGTRPSTGGGGTGGGGGGSGGNLLTDHPSLEEDPGTVTSILCALADIVEDLDGKFFGDNDGDGIDEFINILTVASIALGVGGIAGLLARGAVAGVNSAAFLNAIASVFGDDIALRISYIAFGEIAMGSTAAAAFTTSFREILELLTDGNPPSTC